VSLDYLGKYEFSKIRQSEEISGCTNIDDIERPGYPKIGGSSDFFLAILGCGAHSRSKFLLQKLLEVRPR